MDKDQIKQTYSMRDIVEQYGFRPNRAGFIKCPFHSGDKTASMKIYTHDAHCFGCNWNGDIFKFVQEMDNCSFKEAFLQLGGEYGKLTHERKQAIQNARAAMAERRQKESERKTALQECICDIDFYRAEIERWEPMSGRWCFCVNELQKALYKHGELNCAPY